MKFTLAWLKDHLETEAPLERIVETLTAIGLELESVHDPAKDYAAFVVGHVVEATQHPNADRLRVCIVDTGSGRVQVICGAPNARAGMKGVFAPAGVTIPGSGILLKASKIRGVDSNGMLCSEREMGLSEEHEGIIELPDDATVGEPFARWMGLDDPVIDVSVTPNRQDCLGVIGIARDLAAAGLGRLKPFRPAPVPGSYDSPIGVSLDLPEDRRAACTCFVGRHFRGLTNGPSPAWMQRRLRAIGLRPISALVDITNYLTYDLGRPLHVFDAAKVQGDVRARMGRPGERLLALNGKEYAIDPEMTVIADDAGPEGLAGVMGGAHSGCTAETASMFLEVALFDPLRTAATGRKLAIESDARYRFERGVDPGMVLPGAERATQLVLELCGGEASRIVMAGTPEVEPRRIAYRPERLATLACLDLDAAEQRRILGDLGYQVAAAGPVWQVVPPTWRSDVHGEPDVVEDLARIAGYDRIPAVALPRLPVVAKPAVTAMQRRVPAAKRVLAGRGMVECVTWSFLPRRHAELFGAGAEPLLLANPISADLDAMRPSLLANLIAAAGRNMARGFADLALFEVGPQYRDETPEGQDMVAAGIRRGRTGPRHWTQGAREVDPFDAKADALAVLAALGVQTAALQTAADAPAYYHPGRSGQLKQGNRPLARFGELHPAVLDALDVAGPLVGFEVLLAAPPLARARGTARGRLELADYPAVERDFAFVVDRDVAAEAIVRAARQVDRNLIADCWPFDVYQGPGVPEGRKSVAVAVRLEPKERTLTDPEIEQVAQKIVAAVAKATGGSLRT